MSDQMSQDCLATRELNTDQNWLDQLDEYDVQSVVLDLHSDGDLVDIFRRQPAWTVDFEDGEAVIFLRNAPRTSPI